MKSKTIIIIVGPTAVGKTSVAIDLANQFQTEIISADSRQCFRELNIGVAKPRQDQLQAIKHYFINSHSIHQEVNAALFEEYALNASREIFLQHDIAIMVGGTGLYIKAFCEGLDAIPQISSEIRKDIIAKYNEYGLTWLQEQLRTHDPAYFSSGEILNPQRMMRALEVILGTGKSIMQFQQRKIASRDFRIVKIGLILPKDQLHQNINSRVDIMMNQGLLGEVELLFPFRELPALNTVGYSELFTYLTGTMIMQEAVELIKRNTRFYAKRQLTWFRKDKSINWFTPFEMDKILNLCQTSI